MNIKGEPEPELILNNMDPKKKSEWLKERVGKALQHTYKRKDQNKRRATCVKLTAILLSGIATLLLGLRILGYEAMFVNIAFALVTMVTILNALEPYFNFRALWVEHELAIARFHRINDELNFYLAGSSSKEINSEKLSEIYKEYRETWNSLNNAWIGYRKGKANSLSATTFLIE